MTCNGQNTETPVQLCSLQNVQTYTIFHTCIISCRWQSVLSTLHRELAPVAKRGFVGEQATGSLDRVLSRSQVKKHHLFLAIFFQIPCGVFLHVLRQHRWVADKSFCPNRCLFLRGMHTCGLKTATHFMRSTTTVLRGVISPVLDHTPSCESLSAPQGC